MGKPHTRKLVISGTKSKIFFNYYKNKLEVINRLGNKKKFRVKFKKNDMYLAELKYFLKCIKNNSLPSPNIKDSKYILKKFLSFN